MPGATVKNDSDVYDHVWHFWWVCSALEKGIDPRYCDLVYPPAGLSLVYHHIGWFDTYFFAVTGISCADPALSFNLSLLLGTLLTGLFGWYLARSWGADRYGALFTALALVWLPSRTAHLLQHYQIANCWALIASLWLCREYLKNRKRRYFLGFAAAMLAAAFQSPFHAIFAGIGVIATAFITRADWKRTAMLVLVVITVMILYGAFVVTSPGDAGSPVMNWREAIYWSAEPQSFILPSPFGLLGEVTGLQQRVSWMPNTYEGVVTPGLVILAAFAIIIWKKKRWRFAAVVLGLFLLSLGPELRILGKPLGIPLPFRLMQSIPVLNGIRAPSRFAILGGVLAAVGAGMAFSLMKERLRALFMFLLLFEMTVLTLPLLSAEIPGECYDIPSETRVLEIPRDSNVRRYALFQTSTGYVRQYAFLARFPDFLEDVPQFPDIQENTDVIIYHRWLFEEAERCYYDSVYSQYFPEFTADDSVWITRRGDIE
ncbi:hypothetical protein DRQ25_07500 [Candidatus Fermentibacteria bacterium]|nr:MAG: hypothetical protein DRQ25_07500 [Candidatus Fermentibacteria bacterium]